MRLGKRTLVIIGVLILLLGSGIAKDLILKSAVTVVINQITGAPVHIDWLSVGVFQPAVRISGLKLYNPAGFSKAPLIDIPTIEVRYSLAALLKRNIHLSYAEINLKEMLLEKNRQGTLNVDSLKLTKKSAPGESKATQAPRMPFHIETLKLYIGTVVHKDYSVGATPAVQMYSIHLHKLYRQITSPEQLAALILSEPLKAAGIHGAAIYGAAMLTGVGVLPVAIAAVFTAKGSIQQVFDLSFEQLFSRAITVAQKMGSVTKRDSASGLIHANVRSAQVLIKLKKLSEKKTELTITARRYMLPKPEVAGGVLYEIAHTH